MNEDVRKIIHTISSLRKQISDLEKFIELHKAIFDGDTAMKSSPTSLEGIDYRNKEQKVPVINEIVKRHYNRDKYLRTNVMHLAEKIIREVNRPLDQGEIAKAFEARNFKIPFRNARQTVSYIGSILYQEKDKKFIHIKGTGYWLRDLPMPKMAWDITPSNEKETGNE